MNENLLQQLNDVTQKVNFTINQIFPRENQPEDLYKASRHLIEAGGKRLRPFLVLKSCEIVGGEIEVALPIAVAIEFIHNFTLIHDDIIDNDNKRRNVQTVHVLWGIPIAITAGDMLFAKAYEAVQYHTATKKVNPKKLLRIYDAITKGTILVCEGQALDILYEHQVNVSEEEYFNMIGKKTSTLLQLAVKAGAIMGGGRTSQIKNLDQFAFYAGLVFQVMDDVLGLTSDEKVLGKPIGSDIRKGKRTLITIHALAHASKSQYKQILSVLGNKKATLKELEEIIQIFHSLKSIDYALKKAKILEQKAKKHLLSFPPTPTRKSLLNLCEYFITREY
jgi:geranylgeranyl diphosphate synthase type I